MHRNIGTKINILSILVLLAIILSAYFIEFFMHEIPCPLCLLQRFGFLTIAFGLLLNLKFGVQIQHYGIVLLGAIFTAGIAIRQILLHIFTASGVYGTAIFGFHLYTWAFVVALGVIFFIAIELLFNKILQNTETLRSARMKKIIHGVFALTIALTLANAITTFLICGFTSCPESPATYKYWIHALPTYTAAPIALGASP